MIDARGLTVSYNGARDNTPALGPVTFSVARGEFVSFIGPSGCGKTTLARTVAGIITEFDGTLAIGDAGPSAVVSTVFQDYGVFPWKTALQNLEFPLRERGHSKEEARAIAHEWLTKLRIDNFADFYPHQLSGGMKQRVSIARALSVQPDILILDEPFASIDAQLREDLQDELMALQQETAMTTILFTHSYDEAVLLSDQVIVLTARPATVIDTIEIPYPRPRTNALRTDATFGSVVNSLRTAIRGGNDGPR